MSVPFVSAAPASRVGHMEMWPDETPPDGALVRDGSALSRTAYKGLFAIIGTKYGAGDGATTFELPDDRGLFERGFDDGAGKDSGRAFGSEQGDALGSHDHLSGTGILPYSGYNNVMPYGSQANSTSWSIAGLDLTSSTQGVQSRTSSTGSTETRVKNRAYLPIIWWK